MREEGITSCLAMSNQHQHSTVYSLKMSSPQENKDGTLSFELSVKLEMFDVIDF